MGSPLLREVAQNSNPGEIIIWDVATGKDKAIIKGQMEPILRLAFSPDGKCSPHASQNLDTFKGKSKFGT